MTKPQKSLSSCLYLCQKFSWSVKICSCKVLTKNKFAHSFLRHSVVMKEASHLLNRIKFSLKTRHIITRYTATTCLHGNSSSSSSIATTLNEKPQTTSQLLMHGTIMSNMLTDNKYVYSKRKKWRRGQPRIQQGFDHIGHKPSRPQPWRPKT